MPGSTLPNTTLPDTPLPRPLRTLGFRRRTLAGGAMAFAAALASMHALPASAEVVSDEAAPPVQSYSTPVDVEVPDIDRGVFSISTFTVVQAPVPLTTEISSGFGSRFAPCRGCSSDHQGIDLTPGAGFPVSAITDGVVSEVGNPSGSLGVYVKIDHIIDGQPVTSVYGHMQRGSLALSVGDAVVRGQQLGLVGNTGSSTGNHLHFEIRPGGGAAVSPYPWLLQHVTV